MKGLLKNKVTDKEKNKKGVDRKPIKSIFAAPKGKLARSSIG